MKFHAEHNESISRITLGNTEIEDTQSDWNPYKVTWCIHQDLLGTLET